MKILPQPAGEPAGLIRKYYPKLGQHLPSPTLPELAGEWFSYLGWSGVESIDYYVADRYKQASNKPEFLTCLGALLTEAEQHAHLSGYGYPRDYPWDPLTPEREHEIEASGRAALRAVREWHTLASLSPIEQFLDRARRIELWQNERHQLATREDGHEEWQEEYGVMLLALQRAIPTAKKKLLRAAYTELGRLLPTLEAGRPLKWQRLNDEGRPFFSSALTDTYAFSEFAPLRPTQKTTNQIVELFFQYLHVHLFEKEWHVWQALILLAGTLGEAAPPTPKTFQEKLIDQKPPQSLDNPAALTLRDKQKEDGTLWGHLCGGFKPEQLLSIVGSEGLGLYNAIERKQTNTASSTNWASLYWGLQYKGFLPEGLSNETACELLKNTFGAKTSKTRIGDTKPSPGEKPMPGTYWARVMDLLSGFSG